MFVGLSKINQLKFTLWKTSSNCSL